MLIGTFLDIEGAFNNTLHEVVCKEVDSGFRKGISAKLIEWIRDMLGRRVIASRETVKIMGWVGREADCKERCFFCSYDVYWLGFFAPMM